jgi:hypothetical protein
MKAYKLIKVSYNGQETLGNELYEEELGIFTDSKDKKAHVKIGEFLKDMGPQVLFVAFGWMTPEVYPQFRIKEVEVK